VDSNPFKSLQNSSLDSLQKAFYKAHQPLDDVLSSTDEIENWEIFIGQPSIE